MTNVHQFFDGFLLAVATTLPVKQVHADSNFVAQPISETAPLPQTRAYFKQLMRVVGIFAREFRRASRFEQRYERLCQRSAEDLRSGAVEHERLARIAYDEMSDR